MKLKSIQILIWIKKSCLFYWKRDGIHYERTHQNSPIVCMISTFFEKSLDSAFWSCSNEFFQCRDWKQQQKKKNCFTCLHERSVVWWESLSFVEWVKRAGSWLIMLMAQSEVNQKEKILPHLKIKPSQISPLVLVCGDPARAKFISQLLEVCCIKAKSTLVSLFRW